MAETINGEINPIAKLFELKEEKKAFLNDFKKEQEDLMNRIDKIAGRLNRLEQYAFSSYLEIQCVPEEKRDSVIDIVIKIGSIVGYDIQEDDITSCTREGNVDRTSYRPRPIILEMRTVIMRDGLLNAIIKYNKANPKNKLNSQLLGLSGYKSFIFVNEYLIPTIKALHAATKKRANEKGYKYVWVKGGKVFVRKTDGAPGIRINTINTLEKQVV